MFMSDEEPSSPYNPIKELFKYMPKNNNTVICPSTLIGKIPLQPIRTTFRRGIYLTSYKGVDSRYLEDVLSLGYTPFKRCSIDLTSLFQNYTLVNNEDLPLNIPIKLGDITRVWPAFGQIGGATEFIAVPRQDVEHTIKDFQAPEVNNDHNCQDSKKCLDCLQPFLMHNATRFQIFKADSVSRPIQRVMYNYILVLRTLLDSELFDDTELFPKNTNNEARAFFKISTSGLSIKLLKEPITVSAGIIEMPNFSYIYVIGSKWSHKTVRGGEEYRLLSTTWPLALDCNCSPSNIDSKYCITKLKKAVLDVISDIRKEKYATNGRTIRLPKF